MTQEARSAAYSFEKHAWEPQCPHGDICTGCDARGYCARMEGEEGRSAASASLRDIRERVDAAEADGWYGYDEQARADVRFLLAELERIREVHRAEQRRSADRLRECLEAT